MLLAINPQDMITTEYQAAIVTCLNDSNMINDPYPLLSKFNLGDCRGAVGDLKESINISQSDQQRADMEAAGKGPLVPFLPARAGEQLLATRAHRTWCLQNANLLAPISIPMWKFWGNLSDNEVKLCEERALSCSSLLKAPVVIPNAFPLAMCEPTNRV